MENISNTKIVSLQFALFFQDIIERPDLEFSELNLNLMNIFDAIPTIVNIPKELPSDIPIVTLRSSTNEYSCNISRSRIDLHYNVTTDKKTNSEIIQDFNSKVFGLIEYLFNKRDFIRFGLICRYFHPDSQAIQTIKNKYFKDSFGQVAELSLRFNQKSKFNDWDLNDMVDISDALAVVYKSREEYGIFIQRDINNDVVIDKTLTKKELHEISKGKANLLSVQSIEDLIK